MALRPLVSAKARDAVAGSQRESSAFMDAGQDLTFVPGYSDKRRRMDSDIAQGRIPEDRLTMRMQYVTCQRPNGRSDTQKISQYRARGYQFVEFDNPPSGIGIPPQAFKTPDGHVQVGDTVLMYCDAATAHRQELDGRSAIDERNTDEFTSQDLHSAGREVGGVRKDMVETQTQQRVEVTPKG